MDQNDTGAPDLTGAEAYVTAAEHSMGTGTWWLLPDETVVYERAEGHYDTHLGKWETKLVVLNAHTLRSSPFWTVRPS